MVHYAVLTEGANELVGGGGELGFEKGEPEDACLLRLKCLAYGLCLILINDIFKVDLVEIICPRM
jgi:hypothetical protein